MTPEKIQDNIYKAGIYKSLTFSPGYEDESPFVDIPQDVLQRSLKKIK